MGQNIDATCNEITNHEIRNDPSRGRKALLNFIRARTVQRTLRIALKNQAQLGQGQTSTTWTVNPSPTRTRKARSWSGWSASFLASRSTAQAQPELWLDWARLPTRPHLQSQVSFKPLRLSTMPLALPEEALQELRGIQNHWLELIERARLLESTHVQYNLLCAYMKQAERAFIDSAVTILPPKSTHRGVLIDLNELMDVAGKSVVDVENRGFTQAWDEYLAAQERHGPQYAIVAEIEKSQAMKTRSNTGHLDYPPRIRSEYFEKLEWFDKSEKWFSNAQRLGFDNPNIDEGLDWVLEGTLGISGHAHIGLWVGYDEEGDAVEVSNIQPSMAPPPCRDWKLTKYYQKLAVKESYHSKQVWDDDDMWMYTSECNDPVPREAYIQRLLSCQADSDDIVHYRDFRLYDRLFMYRVSHFHVSFSRTISSSSILTAKT
nr:hypothetical protein CFP56_54345 [Quercus suber]